MPASQPTYDKTLEWADNSCSLGNFWTLATPFVTHWSKISYTNLQLLYLYSLEKFDFFFSLIVALIVIFSKGCRFDNWPLACAVILAQSQMAILEFVYTISNYLLSQVCNLHLISSPSWSCGTLNPRRKHCADKPAINSSNIQIFR